MFPAQVPNKILGQKFVMSQKEPKLDGKVNRQTHLMQFEIASELNCCSEKEKRKYLAMRLTVKTLPILPSIIEDVVCNYPPISSGMEKEPEWLASSSRHKGEGQLR